MSSWKIFFRDTAPGTPRPGYATGKKTLLWWFRVTFKKIPQGDSKSTSKSHPKMILNHLSRVSRDQLVSFQENHFWGEGRHCPWGGAVQCLIFVLSHAVHLTINFKNCRPHQNYLYFLNHHVIKLPATFVSMTLFSFPTSMRILLRTIGACGRFFSIPVYPNIYWTYSSC